MHLLMCLVPERSPHFVEKTHISVRFKAAARRFSTFRQNGFSLEFDGTEIRSASGAGDKLSHSFI